MIKNIIFDLGNVIINYNQEKIIKHFTQNKDEHDYIIEQIFKAPEWQMMDLGTITNQEAVNIINQRNNFKYEDLTDEFLNNWYKVQSINRDVVEFAKKLYESLFQFLPFKANFPLIVTVTGSRYIWSDIVSPFCNG